MSVARRAASDASRFRRLVDGLAAATVLILLLKHFAVELYRVPSPSMQPTLVGHQGAGVHDRVLVDQARYSLTEPARWEVVVFRHPLQRRLRLAKRLVGLPGERLRIAGGNLYLVTGRDPMRVENLRPLRRPVRVQAQHWREIFPSRHALNGGGPILDRAFHGTGGEWREDEATGSLTVTTVDGPAKAVLTFSDDAGGLCDRVEDGHAPALATAMLGESLHLESVQDARLTLTVLPATTLASFTIEVTVHRPGGVTPRFRLAATNGSATLEVVVGDRIAATSPRFDLPLPINQATRIAFAHLDDQCLAWLDGDRVATLETARFKTLVPLRPANSGDEGRVVLKVASDLEGSLTLSDLRVDRDLHYTTSSRPLADGAAVFDVPDRHYFVLGDNPRQSSDSRDWRSVTVGIDDLGRGIAPHSPGAKLRTGELRRGPPGSLPRPDENPVALVPDRRVLLRDRLGEIAILEEAEVEVSPVFAGGPDRVEFEGPTGRFEGRLRPEPFVAREDLIGRAVLRTWPWDRFGLIW